MVYDRIVILSFSVCLAVCHNVLAALVGSSTAVDPGCHYCEIFPVDLYYYLRATWAAEKVVIGHGFLPPIFPKHGLGYQCVHT